MGNTDFGWALQTMQEGYHLKRNGWNGKNMYVYFVRSKTDDGRDYLALCDAEGLKGPWTPSSTDLLAHDWLLADS